MNKQILICLSLLISFCAIHCTEEDELTFAERQEFKNVYIDISLAKAAALRYPAEIRDSVRDELYEQVLQIHGMDAATYKSYVERLEDNPEQAKLIYTEALDSLKILRKELQDKDRRGDKNKNAKH